MPIEIYTTPTCTYCVQAKEFFGKNNIEWVEKPASEHMEVLNKVFDEHGVRGVPVFHIKDKWIIGFNDDAGNDMLELVK
jgi:glutaredoxin